MFALRNMVYEMTMHTTLKIYELNGMKSVEYDLDRLVAGLVLRTIVYEMR